MLQVDNVEVFYGDIQALWGVSLVVNKEEIVSLIGSNGAGKTTLIRSIMGLNNPRKGKIFFDGLDLTTMRTPNIVETGVCVVPEGRGLFPMMSVNENLEMGAFPPRARVAREKTMKWVYDLFPVLGKRKWQMAGSLSGGEQQMLAIGKSLMSLPNLLICDEISLGLAPILVKDILKMIKHINDSLKISVLLVDQNIYMCLKLSNRGYVIENGRITAEDSAENLLVDEKVKESYLGYLKKT